MSSIIRTNANLAGPFFRPAHDSLRVVGPMQLPSASALIPNFNNNELFAAVQGRNLNQSLGRNEGEGEKDDPPERQRQHGRAADNGQPPFYCLCGASRFHPARQPEAPHQCHDQRRCPGKQDLSLPAMREVRCAGVLEARPRCPASQELLPPAWKEGS